MAQLVSDLSFDFRNFNLYGTDNLGYYDFANNANRTFTGADLPGLTGGFYFEDLVGWWESFLGINYSNHTRAVTGTGLSFSNGELTGGTATGLMSVEYGYGVILLGFSVAATQLQAAINTVSTIDDFAVLRAALSAADRITGSAFADYAWGWNGNDTLNGNGGNDTLAGNTGNDLVYGQAGNDVLRGDAGADTLHGGAGSDKLYGGGDTQRDVFVFGARSESPNTLARDVIYEFRSGIDDISLAAIDANIQQAGNQAFGWGGKTAGAYKVWYATAGGNATVFADVTGDKVADFSVQVNGVTTLAAGDFLL